MEISVQERTQASPELKKQVKIHKDKQVRHVFKGVNGFEEQAKNLNLKP